MDRERDVERSLVLALRKQKVTVVKFIPDGMTGMPDRLILLPDSRVIWVELKTEGGRLSEIQKYRHEELKKMGQHVEVVWNKEQVAALAEKISTGSY